MPRRIANAILDRVIDAQKLVAGAEDEALPRAVRLQRLMRSVQASGVPVEKARKVWRRGFGGLVLAEMALHVPAAVRLARSALAAELRALREAGPARVREVKALRDTDIMAREAERAGVGDGEAA